MPTATPIEMKAKFGISLSTRAVLFDRGSLDDLLDMAEFAEASGCFHGVWVGDNLLSKPRIEAVVTLSAIAVRTRRVKLGTVCLASFALRDPILFALLDAVLVAVGVPVQEFVVCYGNILGQLASITILISFVVPAFVLRPILFLCGSHNSGTLPHHGALHLEPSRHHYHGH